MSAINGTNVAAPIRPFDTNDSFPTAFANEVKGGHHTVDDEAARFAIPVQRREKGMLVTQIDTGNVGGYENYINNMTPQQHMMALENNPNVKQVIVYNERTGQRYFEVMDLSTMQPVPNTDKMDIMLIDEFELDLKNKVARSVNMNITMPLIVIGDPTLSEY